MGYTGSIYFNGNNIHNEWKSNGTYYCMEYPKAYLRSKPCLLTKRAIVTAIGDIHHGVTGYGSIAYNLSSITEIINGLTDLIDVSYGSDDDWDVDGNCNLVIKMQNKDTYGNSQSINFYRKSRGVSDTPEVAHYERIIISEEQLEDTKRKRILGIGTTNIFSSFDGLKNGRNRYKDMVADIMNIKTRDDLIKIFVALNEAYTEMNEIYTKRYQTAMQLTTTLMTVLPKVKIGQKVYAQYINNTLIVTDGDNVTKIACEEDFMLSELFQNNGMESCGAGLTITDKSELRAFITSFNYLDDSKRSSYIEDLIVDIHNQIDGNEPFTLSIGGGF